MIPKLLHYIWIGNEKPKNIQQCINSYYEYLDDFKIVEWNESNINIDVFDPYLKELYNTWYKEKKYAFCADIVRLYVLLYFGGIYVDSDFEFIKKIPNNILETPFTCVERNCNLIAMGIWGCNNNDFVIKVMLLNFIKALKHNLSHYGNGWIFNTIPNLYFHKQGFLRNNTTQMLSNYYIYSSDYFYPKDYHSKNIQITDNTIAIHHYLDSWKNKNGEH